MRPSALLWVVVVPLLGCTEVYPDPAPPDPLLDSSANQRQVKVEPTRPTEQKERYLASPNVDRLVKLPNYAMNELTPSTHHRFELRLRGEKNSDYQAALIGVRELAFGVADARVPSELVSASYFDLSRPGHAWLVGHFDVPKDATEVDVVVRLDDFGAYESGAEVGAIDTRVPAIHFTAPVALLKLRGRAVIHLDLSQSIVPGGLGGRQLVPNYVVNY